MTEHSLVSCIMPTANRRGFVPRGIGYFLAQDYPHKELVIVDDGTDPIGDLVPADERIRYVRLDQRRSVGAKRNLACEQARGDVIAHWDDDDWQAPQRLSYQVEALVGSGLDLCGITAPLFYDPGRGQAWQYLYPAGERPWLAGSTLCYTRAFWQSNRFADVDVAEDARFVWGGRPERMLVLPDPHFHVGIIHPHNVSSKRTEEPYWRPLPVAEIEGLLGPAWASYQPAPAKPALHPAEAPLAAPPPNGRQHLPLPLPGTEVPPLAVARAAHMELPEFAACNFRQALPWMRRWEIPFALFQARLPTTASLLDCTINPVGFRERLARLWPHVLYRHVSPIQNGQFVLPLVPDAAFDRVVCINTLEHLLASQREALIATFARALKPGGLLVLTSDHYFDSSWERPEFLNAGVMRADRSEVFNGWNRVRLADWVALCGANGLQPLGPPPQEPAEDDATLFCNQPPFAHTSIGGVFTRAPASLPPPKKVVLGLLVWNTRAISLDSARAHLREARLLRRLGHEATLCICDNGSTDGTPDALRAFQRESDAPCHLILNQANRGSSIARNQIIEHMLERGADYLLLNDGDIEPVPFSVAAMLRHMENSGRRLGCLGADHWGQTPARDQATPYLYSVEDCRIESVDEIAFTQYGLFRRAVFEDGVRLEEAGPFGGAGWGYEDNDLAFQMLTKGYVIQGFSGMTYLHREIRSSVRIMRERGIDAAGLCAQRQQYVVDKWSSVAPIRDGPLAVVRKIQIYL